jgi:NAD(P)-dependent dehydrogenase (short-subunit alcohol dehydrogenase family)
VILCGRNQSKLEEIQNEIDQITSSYSLFAFDLSSQKSISDACAKIREKHPAIDILINNAGTVASQRTLTSDGLELQWAVNHLAPLLMIHYLMPSLLNARHPRVIFTNSRAHHRATINWDDLSLTFKYSISKSYNQSKLASMLTFRYLSTLNKFEKITFLSYHPGLVNTDIGLKNVHWFHFWIWQLLKMGGRSTKHVVKELYELSISEYFENDSFYFKGRKAPIAPMALQKENQVKMWQISLKHCNINPEEYGNIS